MRVSADDVIFRRVTAGRQLEQVVARARAYNADPSRLLTIASITVLRSCPDPAGGHEGGQDQSQGHGGCLNGLATSA